MSSNTVVGIGEHQNPELIEMLERMVLEAKEGRLTSLISVVIRDGEIDYELDYGELSTIDVIGGIELLKQTIIIPMIENDDE